MDTLKIIIITAISLILVMLVILSVKFISKRLKKNKGNASLLLKAKQCIMERREYDLYNTMKSLIDNDKYCLFYSIPFTSIFDEPMAAPDPNPLQALTADFVICDNNTLKPLSVILLDYNPSSFELIASDIPIINMPDREFYTRKEMASLLKEYRSPSVVL